ncbi:MAG: hypothetical protein ACM3XP_04925 [Nitrososphaerales archaeon]
MIGILGPDTIWIDQRGRYFKGSVYDSNDYPLRYAEIAISYLISAKGTDGYTYIARQIFPVYRYHERILQNEVNEPMD